MQSMTLEQLRTASKAGGVLGVTLKGRGAAFFVQISTRNGSGAVLAKARSVEPRCFGNPAAALNVLRDVGITTCQVDASEWNPAEPAERPSGSRGQALRKAHEAVVYNQWLAAEIQKSIDDPRPNFSHEDVLAEMDADIAALVADHKSPKKKHA